MSTFNDYPTRILCRAKGEGIGVQVPIAATTALRGSEHCVSCVPRTHCDRYDQMQRKETSS